MKFWSWIPQNGRDRALLLGNWWNWQHPLCKKWNYKLFQKYTWLKKKKNSEPSNQPMDSRNVNFSIKKSQIDTHMLGVAQKLTKLDIALETSVAWDSGSGSQKMPCPAVPNPLLFTFLWDRDSPKIRQSNKFFGNNYVLKKIKLFLGNSKLNALIYKYLT